jgi:hypothetical protein
MRWNLMLAGIVTGALIFAAATPLSPLAAADAQVVGTATSSQGNVTIQQGGIPAAELPVFGVGIISGVVTDGKTGLPLEGALVQLGGGSRGAGAGRPREMTDARGRFIFTHLAPFPDYSVIVSRIGYMDGGYKRTPGVPVSPRIALRDGEWFQDGNVELWKPASITGTVI